MLKKNNFMKPLLISFILCVHLFSCSQNKKIYNPQDNAKEKIDSIVIAAQKEHKYVLLQIGGNWCIWCQRFNKLTEENKDLKNIIDENYLVYHVNYSKENKNEEILTALDNPEQYGFPVFVILNEKGERIHTQQSDLLEHEGTSGYDINKVTKFLEEWSPKIIENKTSH